MFLGPLSCRPPHVLGVGKREGFYNKAQSWLEQPALSTAGLGLHRSGMTQATKQHPRSEPGATWGIPRGSQLRVAINTLPHQKPFGDTDSASVISKTFFFRLRLEQFMERG